MSTLLLIPWVIFGYRHPSVRFAGLCQTRKSILILFAFEIIYWFVLVLLFKRSNSVPAEGSFGLQYILFYEKGIIPLWWLTQKISPTIADRIDAHYKVLYLLAALIMDYIFLFILSPRVPQILSRKKQAIN